MHHFADDTKIFHFNDSIKKLNQLINLDMKSFSTWSNGNKVYLNVQKRKLVTFKHTRKKLSNDMYIDQTKPKKTYFYWKC